MNIITCEQHNKHNKTFINKFAKKLFFFFSWCMNRSQKGRNATDVNHAQNAQKICTTSIIGKNIIYLVNTSTYLVLFCFKNNIVFLLKTSQNCKIQYKIASNTALWLCWTQRYLLQASLGIYLLSLLSFSQIRCFLKLGYCHD